MLSDAIIGWNRTGGKTRFASGSVQYGLWWFWPVLVGFQTELWPIFSLTSWTSQFGLIFKTIVETDQIFFWLKYAFFLFI